MAEAHDAAGGAPGMVMVVLTTVPALEDRLTDWLLERGCQEGIGFTTSRVGGHTSRLDTMSTSEQVSGRRRSVQFQIVLEEARGHELLDGLARDLDAADIHYWVVPVLRAGRLDGGH